MTTTSPSMRNIHFEHSLLLPDTMKSAQLADLGAHLLSISVSRFLQMKNTCQNVGHVHLLWIIIVHILSCCWSHLLTSFGKLCKYNSNLYALFHYFLVCRFSYLTIYQLINKFYRTVSWYLYSVLLMNHDSLTCIQYVHP